MGRLVHNFSAGPSSLPLEVLEEAQQEFVDYTGSVAWDGAPDGHTRMPAAEELTVEPGTAYLHVTSNETIEGIRFARFPDVGVPLAADMSSDFFSRPVPWERFDIVYAGTQKNLGPAGMAVVVVRRAILDDALDTFGTYLRYATHAQADSLHNTPPTFTVYMTGKVLSWIKRQGDWRRWSSAPSARPRWSIERSTTATVSTAVPRNQPAGPT